MYSLENRPVPRFDEGAIVDDPAKSAALFAEHFPDDREAMLILMLDGEQKTLGPPFVVAIGTANSTRVIQRDVFREAIKRNAMYVVMAHNHPQGQLVVSDADRRMTKATINSGNLLGVQIVDHLIMRDGEYRSMAQQGDLHFPLEDMC